MHVNGASHEAGQLRISFTQFGKSNPRDASFTDHPSTTQYGREASPVHSSPIVEYKSIVSKSFFYDLRSYAKTETTETIVA